MSPHVHEFAAPTIGWDEEDGNGWQRWERQCACGYAEYTLDHWRPGDDVNPPADAEWVRDPVWSKDRP